MNRTQSLLCIAVLYFNLGIASAAVPAKRCHPEVENTLRTVYQHQVTLNQQTSDMGLNGLYTAAKLACMEALQSDAYLQLQECWFYVSDDSEEKEPVHQSYFDKLCSMYR